MNRELLQIARKAIETHLTGRPLDLQAPKASKQPSQGAFVTLWLPGNTLRGCIGHMQPLHASLAEEIVSCAISAATEDPRFDPLAPDQLSQIKIEISLLNPLQPVEKIHELNPKTFGVLVESGYRRGVLLPDIEGVDTVELQLSIAKQKAGIRPNEPVKIQKFTVTKIHEESGD